MKIAAAVFAIIVSFIMIMSGYVIYDNARSAMHEIYSAIYVASGVTIFALSAVMLVVAVAIDSFHSTYKKVNNIPED